MNLPEAGSRQAVTNRWKGKWHFRAAFGRPRFRGTNGTHLQTREVLFSLSQEVRLVVVLKTVHFTVHFFFFFLAKEISMYILATGMMLPQTPSQGHAKQRKDTCHDRARSHWWNRRVAPPLPLPTAVPPGVWPQRQTTGGIWGRFLNGYILKV